MTGSHEVGGSTPPSSTKYFKGLREFPQPLFYLIDFRKCLNDH